MCRDTSEGVQLGLLCSKKRAFRQVTRHVTWPSHCEQDSSKVESLEFYFQYGVESKKFIKSTENKKSLKAEFSESFSLIIIRYLPSPPT